ncbi:16478_t:CDS:2 [Funneliformis mosseae]|uniref:16478_t:CDS:1 n=1 Tax=Funneliformis mosseae TaxID=27381 RepID=A0A9N9FVK9_FUNMO|nr:16478_t:CDS:2 [Funneliformis mosseae]
MKSPSSSVSIYCISISRQARNLKNAREIRIQKLKAQNTIKAKKNDKKEMRSNQNLIISKCVIFLSSRDTEDFCLLSWFSRWLGEKSLKDLETKIKELEQSNEGLRSQFKYLEEKVRERDEEIIVNINNLEEKVREREEETKAKQEIINNLEEKLELERRGPHLDQFSET